MDSEKCKELLEKYWTCETSLEEEVQLREYFRRDDLPESSHETATLFRYFDEQKTRKVEPHFDHTVLQQIKKTSPATTGRVRSIFYSAMRIAAGVAVVLAAIYFVRQEIRKDDTLAIEDTYTDPQQAFEETKKALLMISKGFGNAEQQAKKINVFNEAQEKIQDTTATETEL
jgi:hypothetical protein